MPTGMECGWNRQRYAELVLWRGWHHRCVTGPQPSAVELHGYLSYIVMCAVTGREYTIYGYKGKAFSVMRCSRTPEASGAFDRICSR